MGREDREPLSTSWSNLILIFWYWYFDIGLLILVFWCILILVFWSWYFDIGILILIFWYWYWCHWFATCRRLPPRSSLTSFTIGCGRKQFESVIHWCNYTPSYLAMDGRVSLRWYFMILAHYWCLGFYFQEHLTHVFHLRSHQGAKVMCTFCKMLYGLIGDQYMTFAVLIEKKSKVKYIWGKCNLSPKQIQSQIYEANAI